MNALGYFPSALSGIPTVGPKCFHTGEHHGTDLGACALRPQGRSPHRAEEANATQESSTDLVEGRHPDPQASSMAWEGREGDPPFLEPSIPNDFDL